jgi:predicted phosphoribosyltransferase
MRKLFLNRGEAARLLVDELKRLKIADGIVLAIPRGGVPIGAVVARDLRVPLDLMMSKKIGHPMNEEFAVGSVTLHDVVLSDAAANLPKSYITSEVKRLRESLQVKYDSFTGGRKPYPLKGKRAIIVDDGLATGNTMLVCIDDIRKQNPKSIIVAVPVSSRSAARKVQAQVDQFICLETPFEFYAVGEFYEDFSEVQDQEVIDLLKATNASAARTEYSI